MIHDSAPTPDSLIVRVRKLLDKAEATNNSHEAEAFSRKAAELVARHRISPERLKSAGNRGDELDIVEINVGRGAYVRARLALLGAVAAAHDVRVVFQSTPNGTIGFAAGFRHDLDMVEMIYASLHQQAAGQMAEIKRATGAATQRYRRSFLFGFADRIGELLREAGARLDDSSQRPVVAAATVALRERSDRVDEFVTNSWGRVRAASTPSAIGADGFRGGASAAERADVGRSRLAGRRAIGRGE